MTRNRLNDTRHFPAVNPFTIASVNSTTLTTLTATEITSSTNVNMAASLGSNNTAHAPPGNAFRSTTTLAHNTSTTSVAQPPQNTPSIRLIPHYDPRSTRPPLNFPAVTRILPASNAVIRVGRYSERDNLVEPKLNTPSAAPVGFKSKVVSRRHCEFWCDKSQWFVRDVKSSSGTFLNSVRLSAPNTESKPSEIKDGDIVQLGIDFRGGEELIFRCVKIRVELNRDWQKVINPFNQDSHRKIQQLANRGSNANSINSTDCTICLLSISPCQSLFVAPCSHVWHYKCIRPILQGPTYPILTCPNCRATHDLDADIEEEENSPNLEEIEAEELQHVLEVSRQDLALDAGIGQLDISDRTNTGGTILTSPSAFGTTVEVWRDTSTPPASIPLNPENGDTNTDGLLTPRNDAGPYVIS